MPQFPLSTNPGVSFVIDYTNNGKVQGFTCTNTTGAPVYGEATLTDGRTFGQVFQPGATSVNFPANAVGLTFDAQNDPVWTGLASFRTRVPA